MGDFIERRRCKEDDEEDEEVAPIRSVIDTSTPVDFTIECSTIQYSRCVAAAGRHDGHVTRMRYGFDCHDLN